MSSAASKNKFPSASLEREAYAGRLSHEQGDVRHDAERQPEVASEYRLNDSCRLCLGPMETVLDLGKTPLANELRTQEGGDIDLFPLYLTKCKNCGHVQLPVVVNPERLFRHYVYESGTNSVFREHLKKMVSNIAQYVQNNKVLEVASNDGTMLREFKRLNFEVLGVDPARNIAAAATASGIETVPSFFTLETARKIVKEHGKFGMVVANNVFAHVADIHDLTRAVAEVLDDANESMFVFEVGYLRDIVEGGHFDVIYHEHLDYHQLKPLKVFLGRYGLNLWHAERVASQGGSIRCFASNRPGRVMSADIERLMKEESAVDVRLLAEKVQGARATLLKILTSLPTGTLAGYGCPAKLTTFMAAMQIRGIKYVVDDSRLKIGKWTPDGKIPILPVKDLDADYCLIFSWNFADEIIARNSQFKGKWIVPFPVPRVI